MKTTLVASVLALLGLTVAGQALAPQPAQFLGSYTWPQEQHKLGGFSGLELAEDGLRFSLISDHGILLNGRFQRSDGKLSGVQIEQRAFLHNKSGKRLTGWQSDSEGLAAHSDGHLFVSFEGMHRVLGYATPQQAIALDRPNSFKTLQGNSGFEALAIDAQNRLYAIPERSGKLTRPFPVWRFQNGTWDQPFALRRDGGFLPVGADFGPDGWLYLLEREFTGFGFRSRVRRFSLVGDRVSNEETLLETNVWAHDNLEGLAVWQDKSGDLRLTMVSDDNFRSYQRTEFVEYILPKN